MRKCNRTDIYVIMMTSTSCNSRGSQQNEWASHHPSFMHTARGESGSQRISVRVRERGSDRCSIRPGCDSASPVSLWRSVQVQKDPVEFWLVNTQTHTHAHTLTPLPHRQLYDSDHVVRISEYGVRLFYSEQVLTSLWTSCTDRWPLTECCTNWLLCHWLPERTITFVLPACLSPSCRPDMSGTIHGRFWKFGILSVHTRIQMQTVKILAVTLMLKNIPTRTFMAKAQEFHLTFTPVSRTKCFHYDLWSKRSKVHFRVTL